MSPLERAARAAVKELYRQYEEGRPGPYVCDEFGLSETVIDGEVDMMAIARAVLLAIREPSEGMFDAIDDLEPKVGWYPDEPGERNSPEQIWQAMIDAALEEG